MIAAPPLAPRVERLRPPIADPVRRTAIWVRAALDDGLLDLPLPGRGATEERFATLAAFGRVDLDLARLVEAHADAVAILADLGADLGADPDVDPGSAEPGRDLWGVWAANPPTNPLRAMRATPATSAGRPTEGWMLEGDKPWCSGAGACDRALVTAVTDEGYRLFAVRLGPPTAEPVDGTWPAAAMRGSDSRTVRFASAPAVAVGEPEEYLRRPGFWHGAVGVAAVWLGGARAVAAVLAAAAERRALNPHAAAHAGAVDADLAAADALLRQVARQVDDDPEDKSGVARRDAGRVRAVVERTASEVVDRVGRALGAAPLALDTAHGQRVSDLGLYLRQSHAERDLESHGTTALTGWAW